MYDISKALNLCASWAFLFAILFFVVGVFSGIDSLLLAAVALIALFLPLRVVK